MIVLVIISIFAIHSLLGKLVILCIGYIILYALKNLCGIPNCDLVLNRINRKFQVYVWVRSVILGFVIGILVTNFIWNYMNLGIKEPGYVLFLCQFGYMFYSGYTGYQKVLKIKEYQKID